MRQVTPTPWLPGNWGEGLRPGETWRDLRGNCRPRRRFCASSLASPWPRAFRIGVWAMCFGVAKFAGACSVSMPHSSSRKTMSMTQRRLYSTAQLSRIMGPSACAGKTGHTP